MNALCSNCPVQKNTAQCTKELVQLVPDLYYTPREGEHDGLCMLLQSLLNSHK